MKTHIPAQFYLYDYKSLFVRASVTIAVSISSMRRFSASPGKSGAPDSGLPNFGASSLLHRSSFSSKKVAAMNDNNDRCRETAMLLISAFGKMKAALSITAT